MKFLPLLPSFPSVIPYTGAWERECLWSILPGRQTWFSWSRSSPWGCRVSPGPLNHSKYTGSASLNMMISIIQRHCSWDWVCPKCKTLLFKNILLSDIPCCLTWSSNYFWNGKLWYIIYWEDVENPSRDREYRGKKMGHLQELTMVFQYKPMSLKCWN